MPGSTQASERYKWIVLSNTTLGVLMATIDISIMLIAVPDIFRGINIDPLAPGNSFYLLWMILSFMVVTSVLVVSLVACLAAAGMSWLRGGKYHYREEGEPVLAQSTKAA
jgi:hypothetical protein